MNPPPLDGPGLHERDIAVMVGEVKGMLTQVLSELSGLSQRVQQGESSTNARIGELERTVATQTAQLTALTQQHIDDMRRLAEARAADRIDQEKRAQEEREAARAKEARKPNWAAIVSAVVAIVMAVIAVLAFGDVIGAHG